MITQSYQYSVSSDGAYLAAGYMKLDLKKYEVQRIPLINWYNTRKHEDIEEMLTLWAATNHCPLIILAHLLAEDIGYIPELISLIDRQTKHYRYDQVQNQKEGSPYLTKKRKDDIE